MMIYVVKEREREREREREKERERERERFLVLHDIVSKINTSKINI